MAAVTDIIEHFANYLLNERAQFVPVEQVAPAVPSQPTPHKHNPALALAGHFPHLPRPSDNWPPEGKVLVRKLDVNEGTKTLVRRTHETRELLAYLAKHPRSAAPQIAERFGLNAANNLSRLARLGVVKREGTKRRYLYTLKGSI